MTRYRFTAAILLGLLAGTTARATAQPSRPPSPVSRPLVSLARYRGDKEAAVSLTFDDGSQNQAELAVPLLNEFGFHGTFYVVPGLTRERKSDAMLPGSFRDSIGGASWEEWRKVAAEGHEIGDHTLTHPTLTKLKDETQIHRELEEGARLIAAELGHAPLTLAYPHNRFSPHLRQVALACHAVDRVEPGVVYGYRAFTAEAANRAVDRTLHSRGWLLAIIHGIEQGYNPIDRTLLRAHLAHLRANEGRLWVDTYANVSRYRLERQHSKLQVTAAGERSVTFTLASTLDPARFNEPLTVAVHAGVHAGPATASRAGESHPLPVCREGEKLLVDVAPGAGAVTVSWGAQAARSHGRRARHG